LQKIYHDQRAHTGVLQSGAGRVSKAQAPDHNIETPTLQPCDPQVRKRYFHLVEEARHEEILAELDLINLKTIKFPQPAPPQDQLPKRSLTIIQFSKICAHPPTQVDAHSGAKLNRLHAPLGFQQRLAHGNQIRPTRRENAMPEG
jgi:hypothetical protein